MPKRRKTAVPAWYHRLTDEPMMVQEFYSVADALAGVAELERIPLFHNVGLTMRSYNTGVRLYACLQDREAAVGAPRLVTPASKARKYKSTRPFFFDHLHGEWQDVETEPTMEAAKERRADLEELAEFEFEFTCRGFFGGVAILARVPYPYTVMVGLRPGPGGYLGKGVATVA